jgi:hypothetical protein
MKPLMKLYRTWVLPLLFIALFSCNRGPVSEKAVPAGRVPTVFPDYHQVVVPPNIAPLNFYVEEEGLAYHVVIKGENGRPIIIKKSSPTVSIPIKKWRRLLSENQNGVVSVEVMVKNKAKEWIAYKPLEITVANEEIDSHLAYRLINVGYILWKEMGLYQRDLTSFKQTPIMINRNSDNNCMNCHSFSHNNPDYLMFHMRLRLPGTVVSTPDSIFKIETKTDYTLASGAYPAWHPGGKHIAFSVNVVRQFFHSVVKDNEVFDRASDIIIYNIETNTVTTHPAVSTYDREVLPNWSPCGKYLYFCRSPRLNDTIPYNKAYYDLFRIGYNTETNEWGKLDTLLQASNEGKTITFPKISPDGKYIMYTSASHGYFTIYNRTSDLYLLNTGTNQISEFPFNSETVDSYHSWSGNGRWVVFSSKRLDGITTRPFISYFDENGVAHKPFVMPQKDPLFYRSFNINYNIPEMISGPVKLDNQELLKVVWGDAMPVKFDQSVDVEALSGATKIVKEPNLH